MTLRHISPLSVLAALIAALMCVPLGAVVVNLLAPPSDAWPHLASTVLPRYAANTAALALIVALGVLALGTALAWLTVACDFPGRRVFDFALILPLAVPAYVMAYAYTDFLQVAGPVQTLLRDLTGWSVQDYWFPHIRSLGGAAVMLIFVLYPYVYLLARATFLEQGAAPLEVARSLGAGPWDTFWRVALPLARPALAGGVALALMETLADFGTVSYFGVQTFTTGIYRAWFSLGDPVAASQLASLLLGTVALILLAEQVTRGRARTHHTSRRHHPPPRAVLNRTAAAGAISLCVIPLVIGFLAPIAILIHLAVTSEATMPLARFFDIAASSVTLAGIASFGAVVAALVIVFAARNATSRLARISRAVASLGYAVPGSIIAVGILVPLAALDRGIDAFARAHFGTGTGLLFTGSLAALVYACMVRFLAPAIQSEAASLARIPRSAEDSARVLGFGPVETLFRVHMPMMRASLITAALIVFVDVLKELPATILMRPFNFTTLAIEAYNLASDERLGEAAIVALAIVAVALVPVILMARRIARPQGPGDEVMPEAVV